MLKRWSTDREFRLLDQLLSSQGRSKLLLDLPCGGGRLSPRIGAHTDLLIEADIAVGPPPIQQEAAKDDHDRTARA